jgi:hypothetical protein
MLQQFHQATYTPIAPEKIADLRQRVETVADDLEAAGFSATVIARAMLVVAAERLMHVFNPLGAIWIISRLQGLMCGQWTETTTNDFVENYRK